MVILGPSGTEIQPTKQWGYQYFFDASLFYQAETVAILSNMV